ncbi:unnamed protein product [Dovyalis caffra]|uniref:Uncharacterized protein n=1 Tax=Dovyalis caffra TaxID=77055 RepID=A0AAV1RBU2_9ROSI|nr:unnamed protein product [Dovyalis caffra]
MAVPKVFPRIRNLDLDGLGIGYTALWRSFVYHYLLKRFLNHLRQLLKMVFPYQSPCPMKLGFPHGNQTVVAELDTKAKGPSSAAADSQHLHLKTQMAI